MRAIVAAAVVLLCGCPSPSAPDAGDVALAFCKQYAAARCDLAKRCDQVRDTERAYCEDFYGATCMVYLGGRYAKHGASHYDADAGAQCLASLTGATGCDDVVCFAFDMGGDLGGPCMYDHYCRQGFCSHGTAVCPVCTAYQATGQPCSASQECDPTTSFCDGTCRARLPAGSACTEPGGQMQCQGYAHCVSQDAGAKCGPLALGDHCTPFDCAKGSYCQPAMSGEVAGVCTASVPNGQPCPTSFYEPPCADGACRNGVCAAVPPTPMGQDAGEACNSAAPCWPPRVCRGSDAGTTCQLPAPEGSACDPVDRNPCARGLVCGCNDFPCTAYTCRKLSGAGGGCPCSFGFTCRLPLSGTGQGSCVPVPELGDPCTGPLPCIASQACIDGYCVPLQAEGGACTSQLDCESYVCVKDGGANGTCGKVCY